MEGTAEDVPMVDIRQPAEIHTPLWNGEQETVPEVTTAISIDAIWDQRQHAEEEMQLQKRNGNFKPDITPFDPKWVEKYSYFREKLRNKTTGDVLDEDFDEAQRLLLEPPLRNKTIFDLQTDQAEEYKQNLAGPFKDVNDNIITKLTMVWFGLPVEPITYNNVIRAHLDQSDPEDSPLELPGTQRVKYVEKSLEFLNTYWERSYGFQRLHSKSLVAILTQIDIDKGRTKAEGNA